ncbi:TAR DNA-binding protein 43-like [Liolophura sinensis]|uniref:TAR DNA-binding protein 43-like n=1 Tax=Liolophura sinensis TaxID=3198878 RepID=UPI003158C0E9
MASYIQVAEDESEEPMEIPCESDGTLLLSTLVAQFPGACGLKFRNPETGAMRGIRLVDGQLHPPEKPGAQPSWGSIPYIAVFPKGSAMSDNKRKGDDALENPIPKTKKLERSRCSDLIVLGLPWKTTEDIMREYFSTFGELLMVQVKKDPKTRESKGFGFVRFKEYEAQKKCLSQRHMIDGRWCDVRIPNSKEGSQNRKVFIGRCTEDITEDDLHNYFSQFGEVIDVFIPKPFRAFAFVTFADPDAAQHLCGEDHIIKNTSVHISSAAPKNYDKYGDKKGGGGGGGSSGGGGGGGFNPNQGGFWQGYGPGGWGNQGGRGSHNTGGSSNQGNMGNNMGGNMGGFNLGAFPFNTAMLAAALSGQGGWGLLNMGNQGHGGQNTGGGGGGGGDGGNQGGNNNNNNNPGFANVGQSGAGGSNFLGWGNSHGHDGSSPSPSQGGWGSPAKPGTGWN